MGVGRTCLLTLVPAIALSATRAGSQGIPARRVPIDQLAPRVSDGTRATATSVAASDATRPTNDDARDGVWVPIAMRSLRVLRADEVVRAAPSDVAARRGTVARDTLLPALEARLGPGCASRWIRVSTDGWMCLDETQLAPDPPLATAQPVVHAGDVVPYHYAFAAYSGVPVYRRLQDVDVDDRDQELERGFGIAIDGSGRLDGRTFMRTLSGRWIANRDLNWARPSNREGVLFDATEPVESVGFVGARVSTFATADAAAGGNVRPTGVLLQRTGVHVRERQTVRGHRVVRTDQGWIRAETVRGPESVLPPDGTGAAERWVDVDTRRQILVAYEGARAVMATLVSTGRSGARTAHGVHRVWVKLATSDMSNMDTDQMDTTTSVYSVQRVPWVMYFHGDQALHGAYWHDQYGTARSHGCVNLPPRVAQWLFDWAPPALPAGWTAVFPTDAHPGLRVRVR